MKHFSVTTVVLVGRVVQNVTVPNLNENVGFALLISKRNTIIFISRLLKSQLRPAS